MQTAPSSQTISKPVGDKQSKIAIIGGGVSGITAAYRLTQRGYCNIAIFEKEKNVGGKIRTVFHDGHAYELGALVANHDFKRTLYYSSSYDEHLTKTPDAFLIDEDGRILAYRDFIKNSVGMGTFLASSLRFWRLLQHYPELKQFGFKNVSEDLFAPVQAFAETFGISVALNVIKPFIIACGYGFYEQTPALYLLKLAPWVLKQPFTQILSFGSRKTWSTFDHGWQSLLRQMSQGLDVRLATEVRQIARHNSGKDVAIEVRTDHSTEIFDRLIISSPMERTSSFLDLTPFERELLSPIKNIRYLSTLIEGENLFTAHFQAHTRPDTLGHITCIVQEHPQEPVFQIYQMLGDSMTLDEALLYAHQDLQIIEGTIKKVIIQKEWSYFPHVDTAELHNGYYEALESIQGNLGTYFCGSLFNFETVEHNIRYAEELTRRFF